MMGTMSGEATRHNVFAAARGSGLLAGGRVFEYVSRFLIVLLMARFLGVEEYGLYVLSLAIGSLLAALSLLGIDQAMIRYVAILSARNDRTGVWGTVQVGLGVSLLAGVMIGTVLLFGAVPIADRLFGEPRLTTLLRLVAIIVPVLVMRDILGGIARGFHRMGYVAFAENIVTSVVRLLLVGVAVLLGQLNAFMAVALFGIGNLGGIVTFIVLLRKQLPLQRVFRQDVQRNAPQILGFALPLWLAQMLYRFRQNILAITLGSATSAAGVGIFSVAARLTEVSGLAMRTIGISVRPILAQLHDRRDREGLAHLYRTATRWSLTLSVPFFLITVLYPEPLLRLFGESFRAGSTALIVLAFSELVNAGTGICGVVIEMTGHLRIRLMNSVLWIVLLVVTGATLIPTWGVLGAATSMFISTAIVNVVTVIEIWVVEGLLPFELTFWKPIGSGLAAVGVGLVLQNMIAVHSDWRMLGLEAVIVLATYVGLLMVFRLGIEDRMIVQRMIEKVRFVVGRGRSRSRAAGRRGR